MKRYLGWVCIILALSGGIFAGWVDFNNNEPQAAVRVNLAVTFLLGLILPKRAWLWAVIVALCLPGVHLFARSFVDQPAHIRTFLSSDPPNPCSLTEWIANNLSGE